MTKKTFYIVRHAKAGGQESTAKLTEEGRFQAIQLKEQLKAIGVEKIISSPFLRAIQTVVPLAEEEGMHIETDARLSERMLSGTHMNDWLEKLARTFDEPDLCFEGGESSSEALARINSVVEDVLNRNETILLVSHGNLISLFLKSLDNRFGFNEWKTMKNPHVFRIEYREGRPMFFDLG